VIIKNETNAIKQHSTTTASTLRGYDNGEVKKQTA